jgi:DNA-directed RNA polymerase subunit RPC12/RpoP
MLNFDSKDGWLNSDGLVTKVYKCGYCGKEVASNQGYRSFANNGYISEAVEYIYICHNCNSPTYFNDSEEQTPGYKYGDKIQYLPEDVSLIYDEAGSCFSVNAYTSAVLCCRKLLMNVACEKGAPKNKKFEEYVDYLNDNGYIPPDGRAWVDKIRKSSYT